MIERFFRARDPWGQGLTLWVVAGMVFSLPLIGLGLSRVRLQNDVTSWLPAEDPDAKLLHWFHDNFEHESRVLISWDGSSLTDPRIDRFTQALMAEGEFKEKFAARAPEEMIADIITPQENLQKMVDNDIAPAEAVRRLTGVLIGPGLLKVRWTEAGRQDPAGSQQKLQAAVTAAGLALPLEFLPPAQGTEPAAESEVPPATLSETEESGVELNLAALIAIPPHDTQLQADGLTYKSENSTRLLEVAKAVDVVEDCFYAPGTPVAISISLTPECDERPRALFEYLPEVAEAAGIPAETLHLGGGPVSRYRLNKEAERALWNPEYSLAMFHKRSPIILSTMATVFLTFWLLKSFRLATLVLGSSLYITLAVVALIPATGKSLNMVLIVLPNLLMVLTTSGAIHLANYWKHEAALDPVNGIARAVKLAWLPCVLASVTTAVGMASLLTSELGPVRDFGLYSAVGCLLSLAMILIGFPSLMAIWPGKAEAEVAHDDRPNAWERFGRFLVRRAGLVNFLSLASFAAAAYGLVWFQTETKVIRYFPPHTRVFQDYKALEDSLAGIVSVEVLVQFPHQPQIDLTEASEAEVAAAAKRLNVLQRMEIVRRIEGKLANHPGVSGTISLADFRPVSPERGTTPRYAVTVRKTEKAIFEEQLDETRSFAQRVTKPLSVESHGKKINIGEGDELWRIRCQTAILNDVSFSELVTDLQGIVAAEVAGEDNVQFALTGMIPLFLRTQEALLRSLIESFVLAFGLIALIMIVLLKHPVSGLLAMLPNIYPVGVVFGLVAWAAIPVDIGTMITASVALGIAIDGTLHLITWFQEGIRDGLSRQDAVIKSLKHCGPAMWQTSAAISIGMVLLFGADLLLISRFGWLMAGLVVVALIGDIVLLPALLAGWMGAIIERTIQKEPKLAIAPGELVLPPAEAEPGVVSIPLPPQVEPATAQRRAGLN